MKDPNGTVHVFDYDKFGRLLHDRVTAFGTGIDQEIKRLTRAYDPRGLLERIGSYDSATVGAGSLENEVVFEYDDFGNLAKDLQSHAGAVGGSTPSVSYAHEDGFYNNTRLTAMTYPNGRVVQMGYGTTGGLTTRGGYWTGGDRSKCFRSRREMLNRIETVTTASEPQS